MQRERRDFDQSLKEMLAAAHDGFLQLVGLSEVTWEAELKTELTSPLLTSDVVWRVSYQQQPFLVHIELQTLPDQDMAGRIVDYAVRLWRREKVPVKSIVVYLKATDVIPVSPLEVVLPTGEPMLRQYFSVVRLWEYDPQSVLNTDFAELWPLGTLMGVADEKRVVDIARRIAQAPLPRDQRTKLESLVVLFAGLRLKVQQLANLLEVDPMLSDIFKESSLRELLMREVGEEKLQQGLQQGVQIGRIEIARKFVLDLALQHFGSLTDQTRQLIEAQTDIDRLNHAVLQVNTMPDEAALVALLQAE